MNTIKGVASPSLWLLCHTDQFSSWHVKRCFSLRQMLPLYDDLASLMWIRTICPTCRYAFGHRTRLNSIQIIRRRLNEFLNEPRRSYCLRFSYVYQDLVQIACCWRLRNKRVKMRKTWPSLWGGGRFNFCYCCIHFLDASIHEKPFQSLSKSWTRLAVCSVFVDRRGI